MAFARDPESGKRRKQRSRTKCLPSEKLSIENTTKSVKFRETVPSQTSDMGKKTVSVLVHSFLLP